MEKEYLRNRGAMILQRYYDSKNHQKRSIGTGRSDFNWAVFRSGHKIICVFLQYPRTEGAYQTAHQPVPWSCHWHPRGDLPVPRVSCQSVAGDPPCLREMPQGEAGVKQLWEQQFEQEIKPHRAKMVWYFPFPAFRPFGPAKKCLLNLLAAGWASLCGTHWLRPWDWPLRYVQSSWWGIAGVKLACRFNFMNYRRYTAYNRFECDNCVTTMINTHTAGGV